MGALTNVLAELFADWLASPFAVRATIAVLVLGLPLGWLWETVRYAILMGADDRIHIAPVQVHGPLLEAMGKDGVALALKDQLAAITRAQRMLNDRPAPYVAPATARNQGYYLVGLRQELPIPQRIDDAPDLPTLEQAIVLRIGAVTLPISDLANLAAGLLGAVFVPFRGAYRQALIKISLVAHEQQIRLTVHLPGIYAAAFPRWWEPASLYPLARRIRAALARQERLPALAAWAERHAGALAPPDREPIIHSVTRGAQTLEELGDLLRDAAFMVLSIHERDHRDWRGMRALLDGIDALAEYRKHGAPDAQARARRAFSDAATLDPLRNPHALYFHGVMTMVDRTSDAIDEALLHFRTALEISDDRRLQALVHTGMAYCYAQQAHRLAVPAARALAQARTHARAAEGTWRAAVAGGDLPSWTLPHPLIPYTYGLVYGVDERDAADDQGYGRVERLLRAARFYYRAIELDPRNGIFYNNAGWTLMKLTEWGVETVPSEIALDTLLARMSPRASRLSVSEWADVDDWGSLPTITSEARSPTGRVAEGYLRYAVQLQPNNKLTHANLGLLYSTAPFRAANATTYRLQALYHAKRALILDEGYINGYRDLAIALIRYGDLAEAQKAYYQALHLADDPDKDQELVRQICEEIEGIDNPPKGRQLRAWRYPRESLFEPLPVIDEAADSPPQPPST